ncbi:MAG: hypothetical protein K0R03_1170 [Moraxellaceae bacterium]|jgi:hypothetical protein|nr:hypothetical protein [Moraxellaceae bacterium]
MRTARILLLLLLPSLLHAEESASPAPAPLAPVAATTAAEELPALPPPPFVYMVARIKLTGTDLTQVVFFSHNAIKTLQECETERQAGLTTGWQHFNRYYLKTLKGVAYEVDYRCVGSDQQLTAWRYGIPYDHFYLVQTRNNQLEAKPFRNFFACRDALREITRNEDIDIFCAISSQSPADQKP